MNDLFYKNVTNLEFLLNFIPNAIFTVDNNKKITSWNKQAEIITGFSADEVIGKDCTIFTVEPCATVCGLFSPDIKKPISGRECKIRTKDGLIKHISKNSDMLYSNGVVIGGIESFSDITESLNIQNELKIYLSAIEQSANTVIITDIDGKIIYVNNAFEKITGYSKQEAIGNNPRILKTNYHDIYFYKTIWNTIMSGNTWKGDFKNKRKDGSEYWEKAVITPIKDNKNNILFYMAIKEDITGNKIYEKKLKQAYLEYESIFNNNTIGLAMLKEDKSFYRTNKKFESIFEYSNKESEGKTLNLILKNEDSEYENFYHKFYNELNKDKNVNFEYQFKKKSGEVIWVSVTGKIIESENLGNGILLAFHDINKEKKLEDFKKAVNQIMHHDLRSPLASIIGLTNLLKFEETLNENQKKMISMIFDVGNNMLNQLNMFLAISKIEEGFYKLNPSLIDVIELLKNVINIIEVINDLKNTKKVQILIKLNGRLVEKNDHVYIQTDEILLHNILLNLIKNAFEATPENKDITISIKQNDLNYISIHNYGAIPENIRSHFFEKFISAGKPSGTGLGTYSVKLMADTIGAKVSFETDEITGTTIMLTFNK